MTSSHPRRKRLVNLIWSILFYFRSSRVNLPLIRVDNDEDMMFAYCSFLKFAFGVHGAALPVAHVALAPVVVKRQELQQLQARATAACDEWIPRNTSKLNDTIRFLILRVIMSFTFGFSENWNQWHIRSRDQRVMFRNNSLIGCAMLLMCARADLEEANERDEFLSRFKRIKDFDYVDGIQNQLPRLERFVDMLENGAFELKHFCGYYHGGAVIRLEDLFEFENADIARLVDLQLPFLDQHAFSGVWLIFAMVANSQYQQQAG